MKLTPRFDIVPHGVTKKGKEVLAVFKLIVSAKEFQEDKEGRIAAIGEIGSEDFAAFINTVRNYRYKIGYANSIVTLTVERSDTGSDGPSGQAGNYGRHTFNFARIGKDDQGHYLNSKAAGDKAEEQLGTLHALHGKSFRMAATTAGQKLEQMEETTLVMEQMEDDSHILEKREEGYNKKMKESSKFATSQEVSERSERESGQYPDFRVIYANIMREPAVAEQHFGIIDTLTLDTKELLGKHERTENKSIQYKINIVQPAANTLDEEKNVKASYMLICDEGKYYNGLEKIFFAKSDFKEVVYSYHDPYKGIVEREKPHPDGIYIQAVYNKKKDAQEADMLDDPFSAPGMNGYNVVVDAGVFRSLSYHEKEYRFAKLGKEIKYRTSGSLTARCELLTHTSAYRNNILLAWRGDNLLVNRKTSFTEKEPEMEAQAGYKTDTPCEDAFVLDNFFTVEERLIKGSQLQLSTGRDYRFILRTVSYLEHYMPVAAELSGEEQEYTLTLEDHLKSMDKGSYTITEDAIRPDFNSPKNLPIRSVDIIGKKKFDDSNTGYVDNGNHMVLDRFKKERREVRFIYPPSIKLEDIRMLNYLSPERIKLEDEAELTCDEFKYRCVRVERRSTNMLPERAGRRKSVDYLADPRGKFVLFYPGDLATLLKLPKTNFSQIFEYSRQYPFYDDTDSSRLELRYCKSNKSSSLLLNDRELYGTMDQGIYNLKIYSADKAFKEEDIYSYNPTALRISIVDKPKVPELSIPPNLPFRAERNFKIGQAKNSWFLPIEIDESNTWRSLKYTEETTVLKLDQEDHEKLLRRNLRRGGKEHELMFNEYPYEIFLATDGDVYHKGDLRTTLYPQEVRISLEYRPVLGLEANSDFILLMLNDSDKLVARTSASGLRLFLNDAQLAEGEEFSLALVFNTERNSYGLYRDGNLLSWLINYINPEININDIQVPDPVLHILYQQGSNCSINLERSGSYIFVTDNRHSYSARKKVRLFASSPYQAYFPKVKTEFEIGSAGSLFEIMIPNNTMPEKPIIDAEVLLMHTRDDVWHGKGPKRYKSSSTQSLVRITMSSDFMKEGHNKLGIIIRKLNSKVPMSGKASRIGDDITKLSAADFSLQTLMDLFSEDSNKPLFRKYLNDEPLQNYTIEGEEYEVLLCVPFYNVQLKKWQVILPLGNFKEAEAMFVKLSCIKVAPGQPFEIVEKEKIKVQNDTTGSNLSLIADPVIFPVYSPRSISLKRQADHYEIQFEGSPADKLYFAIYLDQDHEISTLMDRNSTANHVPFQCTQSKVPGVYGKILMFSRSGVTISRECASKLLILEFEVHKNYRGEISSVPDFVQVNPLFGIEGIRLINAAEFRV